MAEWLAWLRESCGEDIDFASPRDSAEPPNIAPDRGVFEETVFDPGLVDFLAVLVELDVADRFPSEKFSSKQSSSRPSEER